MLRSLAETAANSGLLLTFALNYGGRAELVAAVRRLLVDVGRGILNTEEVNEAAIDARLDTAGTPDPDLIIRTAGEMRLSNFLLWQASYAEFWSTEVCWPDFRKEQLWEALENYQRRVRKFGALRRDLDPAQPPRREPRP
jgi:undecaprenyl diphosphate synthase